MRNLHVGNIYMYQGWNISLLVFYLLWTDTEWKIKQWDVFPQYADAAEHINCNIFKESFIF